MEYQKKKNPNDWDVDDNSEATFTKRAKNEEGKPFLAPPGMKTAETEAAYKAGDPDIIAAVRANESE